jgi:hypothetical protein
VGGRPVAIYSLALTTLTMPATLDIHSNSDTSGFCVPSALVNITYIPTTINLCRW